MMVMQVLTVVLGLVLVLGLLSLLASTMMEWLENLMKLKSKNLRSGLHALLANTDVTQRVYKDFIHHPRFRQLAENPADKRSFPSEIPPADFQAILCDLLGQYYGAPIRTAEDLHLAINLLPDVDLKNTLMSLYREVDGQPPAFREKLESWFDHLLDIYEARYSRRARRFLFALGLLIAILFNADALQIFKALQSNPEKTRQVLSLVSRYEPEALPAPAAEPFTPPAQEVQPFVPPGSEPGNPPEASGPQPFQAPTDTKPPATARPALPAGPRQALVQRLLDNEVNNADSPLGLGWSNQQLQALDTRAWLFKLSGWGLTALAISFGASFWFDMLRRVLSRRPKKKA